MNKDISASRQHAKFIFGQKMKTTVKRIFNFFTCNKKNACLNEKVNTTKNIQIDTKSTTSGNNIKKTEDTKKNKKYAILKIASQLCDESLPDPDINKLANATQMCNQVIEYDKNCAMAYKIRGRIYIEKRRVKKTTKNKNHELNLAINDLEKSTYLNPNDLYTYWHLAKAYIISAQYCKGIEILKCTLEKINASNKYCKDTLLLSRVYCEIGNAYSLKINDAKRSKNKNLKQAIEAYENSLHYDPNNSNVYRRLGSLCYKIKDYESAIQYFQKSINMGLKHTDIYSQLASAYFSYADKIIEENREKIASKNDKNGITEVISLFKRSNDLATQAIELSSKNQIAHTIKNNSNKKIKICNELLNLA